MIRYSIFLLSLIGMAATAIAHVDGGARFTDFGSVNSHGASIVYQTAVGMPSHQIVLEQCALEDCSDTPQ
jgi:hypothetical protein